MPNILETAHESMSIDKVLVDGDELRAIFISGQLWERAQWIVKDQVVWEAIEVIATELEKSKRIPYDTLRQYLKGYLHHIKNSQLTYQIYAGF